MPSGRQIVQSYGDGRFRIAGEVYTGSVLIFPEATRLWPVAALEDMTLASLHPVTALADTPDILVVGCGERFVLPPVALRRGLKDHGIVMEWMDTGAACRTFNVLLGEARHVMAALLAVQ
ncbi:MAG: Mth938-like domain-containing protein [Rhodospirillales bacterium]